MPVGMLQRQMTSAEFAEWRAFQRLEGPLGPEREDWRAAMIASVIANANRDPKRTRRAYEPDDFIPDWAAGSGVQPPEPKHDPEAVADKVKRYFQARARRAAQKGG